MIERASPTDRAFLTMDTGPVPEQFGVVLIFDGAGTLDLDRTRRLLAERVHAVPRLRQRLIRAPFGCGGPVWVDDPAFDIGDHVRAVECPAPADEQALLDTALSVITSPLPRTAPLWSVVLVSGLTGPSRALVVVLHHVLADGVGGLAALANLVDAPVRAPARDDFPRPGPARSALARDALVTRLRAVRHSARTLRLLRASMHATGGLRPARVAPGSLNRRTGSRLRLAVVRTDITALRAAAHRYGATVNDAVLVAVAGALHRVLLAHGESVDPIVMTVPVSGRRSAGPDLGNAVAPMLVPVPADGPVPQRLRHVAAQVRAHRAAASGPPPIALLGWLFRPLAALGAFRWYMNHQHRFHTLVSHVRGPAEPVSFGGSPIISAIPLGVGPGGNIPVYFEVLSYAGTLAVTIVADPDHFTHLAELTAALRTDFYRLTGHR
ncbi:wax ester/triacylglycerol synthase domain-containing protein [Nocardia crassostreae]|uniref:wax ester/triacylglycerol synthase domain-containing protein n=1 Tax=Nocardia crassostreae TaxID=53428 RepID=UPI001472205B|nr:wax ester/triacylglycerol synthase domain-containing protein [Nocardia crassostreae]